MAFVPAYTDPSPELLATALAFTGMSVTSFVEALLLTQTLASKGPVLASVVVYNFLYGQHGALSKLDSGNDMLNLFCVGIAVAKAFDYLQW